MLKDRLTNLQIDTNKEESLKRVKVHRIVTPPKSNVNRSIVGYNATCMDCYFFQPNKGCVIHRTLSISYNSEICDQFDEYN